MHKSFKNITSILLAVLIITVSGGLNFIKYCCHTCEDEGAYHHCEIIQEPNHIACEDDICLDFVDTSFLNDDTHKCKITRYEFPYIEEQKASLTHNVLIVWILLFNLGVFIYPQKEKGSCFISLTSKKTQSGRELLTEKCVLVI